VEHLVYNPTEQVYDIDIFAKEKPREDLSKAAESQASHLRLRGIV